MQRDAAKVHVPFPSEGSRLEVLFDRKSLPWLRLALSGVVTSFRLLESQIDGATAHQVTKRAGVSHYKTHQKPRRRRPSRSRNRSSSV